MNSFTCLVASTIALMTTPANSSAGFLIIVGWGERETLIREVSINPPLENAEPVKCEIYFRYSYFHLFWCDMWHWGGEYLLHQDKNYWRPTAQQWIQLLGESEYESLPKPFFYQVPFGLIILVALVIGSPFLKVFVFDKLGKTNSLLYDPRYQEAFKRYRKRLSERSSQDDAIAAAVNYLEGEGVSPDEAQKQIIKLLSWAGVQVKSKA
jgi:hypothetical protein